MHFDYDIMVGWKKTEREYPQAILHDFFFSIIIQLDMPTANILKHTGWECLQL